MIRVLIPLDSQDETTFQTALAYAEAICEKAGASVQDIALLIQGKGQLEHTNLGGFLGPATIKALSRGPVSLPGGRRLSLETLTKRPFLTRPSVIIAYYANAKLLEAADALRNVNGVVAVPWVPGEADSWVERWGATIHGEDARAAAPLIDDPVIVRALENLTHVINLSTGLIHPSDKARADETLRVLRAKGHLDPTTEIRSWAIRNGWKPNHAVALETMAKRIWAMKTKPVLSKIPGASESYSRWSAGD